MIAAASSPLALSNFARKRIASALALNFSPSFGEYQFRSVRLSVGLSRGIRRITHPSGNPSAGSVGRCASFSLTVGWTVVLTLSTTADESFGFSDGASASGFFSAISCPSVSAAVLIGSSDDVAASESFSPFAGSDTPLSFLSCVESPFDTESAVAATSPLETSFSSDTLDSLSDFPPCVSPSTSSSSSSSSSSSLASSLVFPSSSSLSRSAASMYSSFDFSKALNCSFDI
mmetsp:Transcript_21186/g.38910  ORF Transcript_21186/g.38910 Transcript_21186/m.38910 type:complete len:231 (-) Transcript_21186:27-719(-)